MIPTAMRPTAALGAQLSPGANPRPDHGMAGCAAAPFPIGNLMPSRIPTARPAQDDVNVRICRRARALRRCEDERFRRGRRPPSRGHGKGRPGGTEDERQRHQPAPRPRRERPGQSSHSRSSTGLTTSLPSAGLSLAGGTTNNCATPIRVLVVSATLPLPRPRRHNWGAAEEPDVG
jgi:hypothetical protein